LPVSASAKPQQPNPSSTVNRHRKMAPPPRRRRLRLRVRDWRVRTKLWLAVALPALGFLTLAGLQVTSSVNTALDLDRLNRELKLGSVTTDLVHAVQRERAHSAGVLALTPQSSQQLAIAALLTEDERAVDTLFATLADTVAPLSSDDLIARRYAAAKSDMDGLLQTRERARDGSLGDRAAFEQYTQTIADLAAIMPTDQDLRTDPALAHAVRSIADLSRAKELTDQIRGRLYAASLAGKGSRDDYESLADLRARQSAALDQFRSDAGPAEVARLDEYVDGQLVVRVNALQTAAINRFRGLGEGVAPDEWWQASTDQLDRLRRAESTLLDNAIRSAGDLRQETWRATARIGTVIAAILLIALLLSWAVGRGISRSLRALRTQALEVANVTLPEAIERLRSAKRDRPAIDVPDVAVRSGDEFGELSDAFTGVHRRAVDLAVEQAVMRHNVSAMFVNLARRSQTLVERQLQLLDQLESSETDPDQLANLFKLDHLATRMRRNDDNLLVLAGSETKRRWVRPVALPAVILAATAEIEQYDRVRFEVPDGVYIVGHAVGDLVHLLAELLENATMFSPPDTTVMVTGWLASDGSSATIGIQDTGIGMSDSGVREANRSLTTPVAIDVAAAERMGLVVVGHLAARQRIRVELRASPGGGVLAYVKLPPNLLVEAPPALDRPELDGPATETWVRRSMVSRSAASRSAVAIADQPASTSPAPAAAHPLGVRSATMHPPGAEPPPEKAQPPRPQAVTGPDRWWTRGGGTPALGSSSADGVAPRPTIPAPRPPVDAGTSTAGLPIRVPMAQLPSTPTITSKPVDEPDPTEVGDVLSRFYSGVARAALDDDSGATPDRN
jgi:hypothetical protein